jgi:shikimate dehydrogenase
MITGRTTLFAVIGSPVDHSLSPAMQNAAFAAAGFDGAFVALPVAPEELEAAVRGARALGFGGMNVTVPHKEAVVPFCAALDDVAAQVGAVNVLAQHARGWAGFNTDAPAVRGLLTDAGIGPHSRALVLGAGGASRAVIWALVAMGARVRLVTGEQVLVRQGALAFRIWIGRAAQEAVMMKAIERHGGR